MAQITYNNILEHILDLSRKMSETLALDPLLEYAMDEAMKLVGAQRGYIVLQNDDQIHFRVIRPPHYSEVTSDLISTSILKEVMETRKPLIIADAGTDARWRDVKSIVVLKIRSVMCVPLISRGKLVGAIYVENRFLSDRFDEERDLSLLIVFAAQAAVAIENASLNEHMELQVQKRTAELERANQQLERNWLTSIELNHLRITMLGHLTHDLRAPLSVVVTALRMLTEGYFGEINPDALETIQGANYAAVQALQLTSDVFDLSSIEIGQLRLVPESTPLLQFLREIYSMTATMPRASGVVMQLQLPTTLPSLMLDRKRIKQVLMNLLSNAFKYTELGSVTMSAEILDEEGAVLISVEDTGKGISSEQIKRVFERYYQIEVEDGSKGIGLGLAISHDLVQLHGGRLWVESVIGRGSTFKFTLPLQTPMNDNSTDSRETLILQ
jgi:signal transduction histidine kinase